MRVNSTRLVRKLDALHNYDCLRANKSMMAWGVEPRVPFLDREFLDVAMRFDAAHKMVGAGFGGRRIEKAVLREAFDGYLPDSILWRQKEQFSDGVGYGWIDGLKAHAEAQVSDRVLACRQALPAQPPQTKEAYYYRHLFEQFFPSRAAAETVPGASPSPVRRPRPLPGTPASPRLQIPRAARSPECTSRHWPRREKGEGGARRMCHKRLNPPSPFLYDRPVHRGMFMDVQNGGQAPQMKWGWRYLGWAVVPLLAGVLLARCRAGCARSGCACHGATEGSWAQHLASPLGLFLLQLLVLLLVARARGAAQASGAAGGDRRDGGRPDDGAAGARRPAAAAAGCAVPGQFAGSAGHAQPAGRADVPAGGRCRAGPGSTAWTPAFAFTVSHAGIAVPFVLGVALAIWLYPQHGPQGWASRHSHCSSAFR